MTDDTTIAGRAGELVRQARLNLKAALSSVERGDLGWAATHATRASVTLGRLHDTERQLDGMLERLQENR